MTLTGGHNGSGAATTGGSPGGGLSGADGSNNIAGQATSGGTSLGGSTNGLGGAASGGNGSAGSSGGLVNSGMPPGDIAASAGTPLVAAHSMTRGLTGAYRGKLFQARRKSDGKTQDIGTASGGGLLDLNALNMFCSGTTCSVAILYDQTGNANDLPQTITDRQPTIQLYSLLNGTQVPMAVSQGKQYLRNRTKTSKIPKGCGPRTDHAAAATFAT
jgi:hypothetical protein